MMDVRTMADLVAASEDNVATQEGLAHYATSAIGLTQEVCGRHLSDGTQCARLLTISAYHTWAMGADRPMYYACPAMHGQQ